MYRRELLKKSMPLVLSVVMAATSMPVTALAAEETAVVSEEASVEEAAEEVPEEEVSVEEAEAEEISEEEEVVEEAEAEAVEEEALEDNGAAASENGNGEGGASSEGENGQQQEEYKYVYAGLSWAEYWASEGVYEAGNKAPSDVKDTEGQKDKGGFDAVSRATTKHGLHRGTLQGMTVLYATDGTKYQLSHWKDTATFVTKDGTEVSFNRGTITEADGTARKMDRFEVLGLKYVPVKVKAADYEDFKSKYAVTENDNVVTGGADETFLKRYSKTAAVTENTNGLKEAVKSGDGYTFLARTTGTDSGLKETGEDGQSKVQDLKKETGLVVEMKTGGDVGKYGEFIRVDLVGPNGERGAHAALGANLQGVRWDYYGTNENQTEPLISYGTKFAADSWMHSVFGFQLGLTESVRCQLPEGTDGTGKWVLTLYALGYEDTVYEINATEDNITTKLEYALYKAEALKEAAYTPESWKKLQEAQTAAKAQKEKNIWGQDADEAAEKLLAAVNALEAYKFVYAGLSWADYWASEDVYNADNTASSEVIDSKGEKDKGGFDAVTRATTNHGIHRGSFQCTAIIYAEDKTSYKVSHWIDEGKTIVLTDGTKVGFERGTLTTADGQTHVMDHYEVLGIKYVPVKVKPADYEDFCKEYTVVENGSAVSGGFGEMNLVSYSKTASVTVDTNGLKEAVKAENGKFRFTKRGQGTASGLKAAGEDGKLADEALKKAENVEVTVKPGEGAYGEFLRVDITGKGYGDLGSNMQAVRWDYYGTDETYTNLLESYGTKFAADNWMHKTNGIQLGLTDSLRCQLPEGTDGTGFWKLTVYALGYEDYSFVIEAKDENIVKPQTEEIVTADLEAAIQQAEALKEAEYTKDSWASLMTELQEAKDELAAKHSQAAVNEAKEHLLAAINALVKVEVPTVTFAFEKASVTLQKGKSTTLALNKKNLEGSVTYTSSNTKAATVDSKGTVKAVGRGTAVITATCGTYKATCQVTVKAPALKLDKTSAALSTKGTKSVALKVTKTDLDGAVTFKTSNSKVATVDSKGTVKAAGRGTAVITASCGSYKATCKVTVKAPALKVNKTAATLYTKGSTKMTLKATKTDISGNVTFTSSNKKVAVVNAKGVVTAKKKGTTIITAKCGSYKATCKVTVKAPSLKLKKTSASIKVKKTVKIQATATPNGKVTYKTSNKKIATVTSKGVVKGIRKGTAVITVTCNGVSKKFKVTVK